MHLLWGDLWILWHTAAVWTAGRTFPELNKKRCTGRTILFQTMHSQTGLRTRKWKREETRFLIAYISYNARYVKYRGVKKASFLRFGFFGSLWTFRWLQCCFIGFLQFFIVWCISFAFYCYNSFSESFSITGFTGRTCIRFLRTVFFFRHASFTFIMVSVLEPFWLFYFSVHNHSFVLF